MTFHGVGMDFFWNCTIVNLILNYLLLCETDSNLTSANTVLSFLCCLSFHQFKTENKKEAIRGEGRFTLGGA